MKRRSSRSNVPNISIATATKAQEQTLASSTTPDPVYAGPSNTQPADSLIESPSAEPNNTTMAISLVAASDDDQDTHDADEPLLPMLSTRIGISEDRARTLFEKYGLKYEARRTSAEQPPPNKIRRVEKPVRIRIHWICHECTTTFGVDRNCAGCGHRRCVDCTRSPAKRVREVLDSARQLRDQEQQQLVELSSQHQESSTAPQEARTMDDIVIAPLPEIGSAERLEEDDGTSGCDFDTSQLQYIIQHPPRLGLDVVLRPTVQVIRRTCHECDTLFKPARRTDCQNCSHVRCRLCPRFPTRSEKWPQGSSKDEEPKMVATVQRVYKKPRQRVRWSCHACSTMFVDRERCRTCGHDRCKSCPRTP